MQGGGGAGRGCSTVGVQGGGSGIPWTIIILNDVQSISLASL